MDIAIIGGGASGLTAAITAARLGCSVCILERLPRVGKKILSTGNGRCNISNANIDISRYHGDTAFAQAVLDKYSLQSVRDFFKSIGLEFCELEDGKLYPKSLQASTVLDMLRLEASRLSVEEITDFEVCNIKKEGNSFIITSKQGKKVFAKAVIMACGGKAAPSLGTDGSAYSLAEKFGHKTTKLLPSLVQLKCENTPKALKGVKHICRASVIVDKKLVKSEYGEVLFTEYGLSGPPIFQLSRIASGALSEKRSVYISLNLLPEYSESELFSILSKRKADFYYMSKEDFLSGIINKKIGFEICKKASNTKDLAVLLSNFEFKVSGTLSWGQAQVTAGGINCDDIYFESLMSKKLENLFFTGEILDVDGDCGGFNLHWAWCTGMLAGKVAGEVLND